MLVVPYLDGPFCWIGVKPPELELVVVVGLLPVHLLIVLPMNPLDQMSTRRLSFESEGRVFGGGEIVLKRRDITLGGGDITMKPSLRAWIVAESPPDRSCLGGSEMPLIENASSSERGGSTFGGGDTALNARSILLLIEKSSSLERGGSTFGGGGTTSNARSMLPLIGRSSERAEMTFGGGDTGLRYSC